MPQSPSSVLRHPSSPNSPKRIWVINPFDPLPHETDVPLRYWALCRTLAAQGHAVVWWSSDFSHLNKAKRPPCPDTDGFTVRLIETPPYAKNISFARLRNHRLFARGFHTEALAALQSGELPPPDRIVVSLPPLGVAESAFRIRDYVNGRAPTPIRHRVLHSQRRRMDSPHTSPDQKSDARISHRVLHSQRRRMDSPSKAQPACQVIVNIMDTWPKAIPMQTAIRARQQSKRST